MYLLVVVVVACDLALHVHLHFPLPSNVGHCAYICAALYSAVAVMLRSWGSCEWMVMQVAAVTATAVTLKLQQVGQKLKVMMRLLMGKGTP